MGCTTLDKIQEDMAFRTNNIMKVPIVMNNKKYIGNKTLIILNLQVINHTISPLEHLNVNQKH